MPIDYKDYYKTLGIAKDATKKEIKKAFRDLARKYHPDKVQGEGKAEAEEKFKEIAEAYEIMGDPDKRKEYDDLGQNWNQNGHADPSQRTRRGTSPNYEYHFDGTGFSDFFEQHFGRASGNGSGPYSGRPPRPSDFSMRGQDIEAEIMVTLEEVFHGANRQVGLTKIDPSTGLEKTYTYKVRIPIGIREGQRLRVSKQGHSGHGTGEPGDLYLRTRLARHPDYRVNGLDLYFEVELFPWEAVLGAKMDVPTFEGNVRLSIPESTTAKKTFRIKGKGLPSPSGERGNLLVETSIKLPTNQTPTQFEAWEQLKNAYQS